VEPLSLEVTGLSHRWPGAERDTPGPLDFRLEPGARGLLLGPNGAGKSTLFQRLVGLLDGPGSVRVGGVLLEKRSRREIRRRVGLLWQRPEDGLLLPLVRDDVALGPANDGRRAESLAIADRWLARLGISHLADRKVRELSVGERQLVALAGVLAREPGVILLDEPASALDERAGDRLVALLAELPATLLLSTHDPEPWLAGPGGWYRAVVLPAGSAGADALSSGKGRSGHGEEDGR
jgi:energy-coupling factor transporter ATP-binding protein EcfA2